MKVSIRCDFCKKFATPLASVGCVYTTRNCDDNNACTDRRTVGWPKEFRLDAKGKIDQAGG